MKEMIKPVYVTFDGKEFISKEDAIKYERLYELRELLEPQMTWEDISPEVLAEYLLSKADRLLEILKDVK